MTLYPLIPIVVIFRLQTPESGSECIESTAGQTRGGDVGG